MAHWSTFDKETEKETKRLIKCFTGVEDEEDQNFQLALKYAWSNFRFHRYLDVNAHKVQRSVTGIYDKLMVHSDLSKAESWKRLTEEFLNSPLPNTDGTKTDTHYGLLSLLLFLSGSPSNTDFTERPRVKETEEEDKFDWASYLMEGEDIDNGPYPDTPEWSEEESDDDDGQQPISREDSGIQLDRTPQEDQDNNNNKTVPVSWTVGEPDARVWLEQHVVTPYWVAHAPRFPHSLHLHSNLLNVWDQHLYNTDPLYLPEEKAFVTETQVIRETLWLLSGVKKHFIFQHHDGKVSVRNNVVVTHLTSNCLRSVLEHIAVYGQAVFRLQRFIDEVTGYSSEPCPPGSSSSYSSKKGSEPPFRTYQAFVWALNKYFTSFKKELTTIEKELIRNDETVTLSAVLERINPHLAQIKVLHKVFCTGVAEVPPETPNVVRASHLLNTLYKAIIEYDSVGDAEQKGAGQRLLDTSAIVMRDFLNSHRCLVPLYDNMNEWSSNRDFEGTVMDNFFNNLHYSNWLIGVKNMASLQNACKPPPNNRGNVVDAGNNTLPNGNTPEQVVTPNHLRKEGYKAIKKIGQGTFSEVVKTLSLKDLKFYACKTLKQTINSLEQAKNLREVQVMRRLSPHANIIQLHDLIFNKDTGTVSLICDLMEMNIHEFIQGRERPLPDHMVQNYMYQLCKALKHMHSYGIFHRDVKPENILIKQNSLKLGDFGLCLSVSSRPPHTEYISTRWYRAPECLLTSGYYDYKMDLWSAGCVFFEIMSLNPLFPGTSELDQVDKIHNVLGTPDPSILQKFKRSRAVDFNFTPRKGTGISRLIPSCPAPALSLLYQMLAYDPDERISAATALQHTCFREIRVAEQNPDSPRRLYSTVSLDHIWRPRHTTLMSPQDESHCTAFKTFYLPHLDRKRRDY